jgi:hypothetical protein
MIKFLTIIVVIIVMILGLLSGYLLGSYLPGKAEALSIIIEARESHRYLENNPELCNGEIGWVWFHEDWVNKYDRAIEILNNKWNW